MLLITMVIFSKYINNPGKCHYWNLLINSSTKYRTHFGLAKEIIT